MRERRVIPADKLRAEFGPGALKRIGLLTALRLSAFLALCLLGSRFFIQ